MCQPLRHSDTITGAYGSKNMPPAMQLEHKAQGPHIPENVVSRVPQPAAGCTVDEPDHEPGKEAQPADSKFPDPIASFLALKPLVD